MPSSLTWLDQSEEHRRKMREAIGLFREEGAVDELGLGRIRDAFSDRLFPGTSVLWRRARYLFFVPWIYGLLASGKAGPGAPDERARRLQRRLARTLMQSEGSGEGVIGASGADVKQPADSILWAALRAWGIRTEGGRLHQIRAETVSSSQRNAHLEDETFDDHGWHPRVMRLMPDSFPDDVSFALERAEAELLRELILPLDIRPGASESARADSLLALLIRQNEPNPSADVPWVHPLEDASAALREVVHNAGCFSDLADGARLCYSEMVAQARGDDELLADVEEGFHDWAVLRDPNRLEEIRAWYDEMSRFWELVRMLNPRIRGEQRFVDDWAQMALADPAGIRNSQKARQLIIEREHAVKGVRRARLSLTGAIGRDADGTVPVRLTFRWEQGKSIARDICRALQ